MKCPRLPQRKEPFPMLGKTIVRRFSEPMAMDTPMGLHRRPVIIPPLAQAEGFPDHISMDNEEEEEA